MHEIAEVVDSLENLIAALKMPLPCEMHVEALRGTLPDLRDKLKRAYLAAGGENVWD